MGTSRRRKCRQKATAAVMSWPATTSAPEYPWVRPSGPGAAISSGPVTP